MERMTGLDAAFLYADTPSVHMQTLKIAVVEHPGVGTADLLAALKQVLSARLHLLPPLRRRAVEIPLGLHHPVWIEDPDFGIEQHVGRCTVPAPGGRAEREGVRA